VSFLCASRPRHPYVSSLAARDGEFVQIDLDDPDSTIDNDATVRVFWEEAARPLGLDRRFVDEAVARAGGNVQHAVTLHRQLRLVPAAQRRVEDIPRGLAALLERSWERIAVDEVVVGGLGILCAAREALTLDEIGTAAAWTGSTQRRAFLRGAKELLVETRRRDGQPEYRLHHDAIRGHIAKAIGAAVLRRHHAELAQRLAIWPTLTEAVARRYALRHALIHRAEAGEWADAWRLAADMGFLETKCRDLGVHETEAAVARVAERCRAGGDAVVARRLDDLARALARESHQLRTAPEAIGALVWNRLRRLGWSVGELDDQLRLPAGARFLRLRNAVARESPALIRELVGHRGAVNACVVTADGQRVISAGDDGTLKVWNLENGRVIATLVGHASWVSACAVTADGRVVVSASGDRRLKVWNLDSGRALATLEGQVYPVNACAVTADGQRLVSASADGAPDGKRDGIVKVWDLENRRVLATLKAHADWVKACAITADGRYVVSASSDRMLKVWQWESGRELARLQGHDGKVNGCAITADGRRVVSASYDGLLKVWDLESGRELVTLKGHLGPVNACTVTADGKCVISASNDRTLKVWDLESGREVVTLEGHAGAVRGCAVTPDGRRVISASEDGTLKVWDLERAYASTTPEDHSGSISSCTVMSDGRHVISVLHDGAFKVWNLEAQDLPVTLEGHAGGVNACAVTAGGGRVVSASSDGTLKVWDLKNRRLLATLSGHVDSVRGCAVTADGRRVASASEDGTLRIWELKKGRTLAILEGHAKWVLACAVTMDGRRVISASSDRTLKVWELESGRLLGTLQGHTDWVNTCVVTADGQRVVSASDDRTLKVWDLATGRTLATLEGHDNHVNACAVTMDGRYAVSASDDRTLKVWELEAYTCLFTHRGDVAYNAVAVTATGIVASDFGGTVWVFDWPSSNGSVQSHDVSCPHEHQRASDADHESPPSRALQKKHRILFLAANPLGTDRLALDQEVRAIQVELERSGYRDCFDFVIRWAAEPLDLLRELRRLKPTVVHFSGHGGRGVAGEHVRDLVSHRDVVTEIGDHGAEPRHGLFFQGADGRAQLISAAALEETFGAAGSSVKLVVLNACYSEAQAEALRAHVDCVVGMGGSIRDDAARNFAIGFYGGLGECVSVAAAYKQGRAAIRLAGLPDGDCPQLKVRDGVDAERLVLAADPP